LFLLLYIAYVGKRFKLFKVKRSILYIRRYTMRRFKIFLVGFAFLFLVNIHIPVLDIEMGFAENVSAGDAIRDLFNGGGSGNGSGNGSGSGNGHSHGVPEPSMFLLLGAGLAGYGIHRKLRNRKKDEQS
jgi:hypothetical protein